MNVPIRSALIACGLLVGAIAAPIVSGTQRHEPVAEASASDASVFVPIESYRAVDTRLQGTRTKLGRSADDPTLDGFGVATGVRFDLESDARIPANAVAVTYNVTVTETEGAGFVQIDGWAFATGGTSTVNWSGPGETVANSGVARLTSAFGEPAQVGIYVGGASGAQTHVVLDITGYYLLLATL